MKWQKFLKISLITIIGGGLAVFCGLGTYYLVSKFAFNNNDETIQNSNSVTSQEWYKFYESNSLKVGLQISSPYVSGNIPVSEGTAWSWYYTYQNGFFDWYLMTNFHVINEAAYYNYGNNTDYINQMEVKIKDTSFFQISQYVNKDNIYKEYYPKSNHYFVSASLIYDMKTLPNNDNPILFSDFVSYSLDMALIKIRFKQDYSSLFERNNVINPVQQYINSGFPQIEMEEKLAFEDKKYTSIIGGHPADSVKLIVNKIESNDENGLWWENFRKKLSDFNVENIPQQNLKNLWAPYKRTSKPFGDWNLTNGASGSPVFQTLDDLNNMTKSEIIDLMPKGIYWGGFGKSNSFYPSIIPFIIKSKDVRYNIYQNFIDYLNT